MSNAVYPSLPGLAWDVVKRPEFNTTTHRATSGKERRIALMSYPLYTFTLTYELLRSGTRAGSTFTELQTLLGFFLSRLGSFDSFLFEDLTDNAVTDQVIGAGTGSLTQFQLVRAYGGFTEPVQNVHALTNIKDNGVVVSGGAYSVSATGLLTFTTPPAAGHAITWTGTYYYRVRFMEDYSDFVQFMKDLWDNKKLSFVGAVGNKV